MPNLREELTASINNAADAYEAMVKKLEGHATILQAQVDLLVVKETSLNERERTVSNREAALDQVRSIAANRKAEIESLKKQIGNADALRATAVAECRVARDEKKRLEDVVTSLIAEKKALQARLDENEPAKVVQVLAVPTEAELVEACA